MNLKKWFALDDSRGGQLHVLRVFERTGRALEDCTARFPIIIGRDADVDVRIRNRTVSRIHCGLKRVDGQLVLTDLESQNGTFVNGRQIRQCVIAEGDEVRLGTTALVVINSENDAVLAIDVKD